MWRLNKTHKGTRLVLGIGMCSINADPFVWVFKVSPSRNKLHEGKGHTCLGHHHIPGTYVQCTAGIQVFVEGTISYGLYLLYLYSLARTLASEVSRFWQQMSSQKLLNGFNLWNGTLSLLPIVLLYRRCPQILASFSTGTWECWWTKGSALLTANTLQLHLSATKLSHKLNWLRVYLMQTHGNSISTCVLFLR